MAPRSCYDILGVPHNVAPEALRAAYIRLMKDHHPDLAADPRAAARAHDINRAFAILRDPSERAAHDHELARARRDAGQAAILRAQGRSQPPAQRPRRAHGRRLGAGLALVAVIGLAGLVVQRPDLAEQLIERHVASAVSLPLLAPTPAVAAPQRPHIAASRVATAIVDFDLITLAGGMAEAESYARRCQAELQEAPSLRLFDHCAAFDTLAGMWEAARRDGGPRTPFFTDTAIAERRADASDDLALGPEGRALRIAEIERVTMTETAIRLPLTRP